MNIDFPKLDKLALDRQLIPSHVYSFLESMSHVFKNYMLIREMAKQTNQEANFSADFAIKQAMVFSVRSLETLMRDCFVTCINEHPGFKDKVLGLEKASLRYTDIQSLIERPERFNEYLAALRNFQSLDVINQAFEPLYDKEFFVVIDEYKTVVFRNDEKLTPTAFSMQDYSSSWRSEIYKLYQERHEIVHNAHHCLRFSIEECQNMIDTALMFGQVAGIIIGSVIGSQENPYNGTITVEAPIEDVMTWYILSQKDDLTYEDVKPKADELMGGKGYGAIGPFIFLRPDLMQTFFKYDNKDEATEGNRAHIVQRMSNKCLRVVTLHKIKEGT